MNKKLIVIISLFLVFSIALSTGSLLAENEDNDSGSVNTGPGTAAPTTSGSAAPTSEPLTSDGNSSGAYGTNAPITQPLTGISDTWTTVPATDVISTTGGVAPSTGTGLPETSAITTGPVTGTSASEPVTGTHTAAPVTEPLTTVPVPVTTEVPVTEVHAQEMFISDYGLEFIKSFEGFSSMPYEDYSHWSIGYGSYVCPLDEDPYEIYPNGISRAEADELFKRNVVVYIRGVNNFLLGYDIPVNQNQFDALVSFTYNVGQNIWKRSEDSFTLKRILVSGNYTEEEITDAFYMWRHAGGKENAGLAKRRLREAALFNSSINVSDPASQGYDAHYYIVNASYLTVREVPDKSGTALGSIRRNTVIQVIKTDTSGDWGYTTYAAFFGWVSMAYLIPIDQKDTVSVLDENFCDEQGIYYSLNPYDMTASAGLADVHENSSQYIGANSGYVYLTGYILHNSQIYTLTSIGAAAFKNNQSIRRIFVPASVTSIASDAFDGSSLNEILYIHGSYADGFANASEYEATDYRCVTGHLFGNWFIATASDSHNARVDNCVCSVCGKVIKKTVVGIYIERMPDKLEYIRSQTFVSSGMIVKELFDDGSTDNIDADLIFSGFDSETLGTQTITVTCGVFSVEFTVRINEKEMTGIRIDKTPTSTTYVEGLDMNTAGLTVTATYNNGSTEKVTEYTLSGYDRDRLGKQTITVSYNGFTASYSITVKAKSVTSISLLSLPFKSEYYCGETFDPEGITARVKYDNGTSEVVEEGFTIRNFNSSSPAESQKVRVYYGGHYKNIYVTIILNRLITEKYSVENGIVYGIEELTKVSEFKSGFEASERIIVYDCLGRPKNDEEYVGTDCTAVLWYNADKLDSLRIVIAGDISGDGMISISDLLTLRDHLLGADLKKDIRAYDVNRDGAVTLTDMVCLIESINKKDILD